MAYILCIDTTSNVTVVNETIESDVQFYINPTNRTFIRCYSNQSADAVFDYCVIILGAIGALANGSIFVIISTESRLTELTTSTKFILNQ